MRTDRQTDRQTDRPISLVIEATFRRLKILQAQDELYLKRLAESKKKTTLPWTLKSSEKVLDSLKTGKCRDPDGLVREIFKKEILGDDLKQSLLLLFNKIKETGQIPKFMNVVNIHAIYKGKGEKTDLESERGIFIVSILRSILMKMLYNDIYERIDSVMSDSNIGARKGKNIRNHIFIVNSIMFDVFQSKSKKPVDLMVLDFKQMFDSEWLQEALNDLYEAGVCDDYLPLIFESNKEAFVSVKTPGGLSKRETVNEIVMQGDVLAPLLSSLHVDAMIRSCMKLISCIGLRTKCRFRHLEWSMIF